MKRFFANATSVFIILGVFVGGLFGLAYWDSQANSDFAHAVRAHNHLKAFVNANVRHATIYRFEVGDSSYIWWDIGGAGLSKWMPGLFGPPVCIFDASGTLVDYTSDSIDDGPFLQRWDFPTFHKTRQEITLDQLLLFLSEDVHGIDNSGNEVSDDLLTEPQS